MADIERAKAALLAAHAAGDTDSAQKLLTTFVQIRRFLKSHQNLAL